MIGDLSFMILIADSGSTKVHWCLLTASGQQTDVRTEGINPVLQPYETICETISNQLLPQIGKLLWAGTVTHVFFYGAGCTPEKKGLVKEALESVFKKAEVTVESDMLGAARGLLGDKEGVACILGTGSGSCWYNGETIAWSVPSLGYILGDEGSGATLGKRLVGDLLKGQLGVQNTEYGVQTELQEEGSQESNEDLKELFFEEMGTSMADIIEHVYRQPFANRYLAGLSRVFANQIKEARIHALVHAHFVEFIRRNLVQYKVSTFSFVGSIAYYYRPILEEAMRDEGLQVGVVLQDPIEGLKAYHRSVLRPTTE